MQSEISNTHLKEISRLKTKKYREETGLTLAEGWRTLQQLADNDIELEELLISDDDFSGLEKLKFRKVFRLRDWQMAKICDSVTPQKIAAVIRNDLTPITDQKFLLYLDRINDPGNLGTLLRTAAGIGISGVVLSRGSCEVFNPKVVRASLGACCFLPLAIHDQDWLWQQKAQIIVSDVQGATNLPDFQPPGGNIILVLGSEAHGVDPRILEKADHRVRISMSGKMESLNVAVAGGILLYHLVSREKWNRNEQPS